MAFGTANVQRKKVDTSNFLTEEVLDQYGYLTENELNQYDFLTEKELEEYGFTTVEDFEHFQNTYKSTYESAKAAGYTGTEEEFYAALNVLIINGGGSGGTVEVNTQTVTLNASWTKQSDGSHAQTISVAGVTGDSGQAIWVDCSLSRSDINADIAVLEAWSCINTVEPAEGSLTFYCYGDTPTVAIPTNVVVM